MGQKLWIIGLNNSEYLRKILTATVFPEWAVHTARLSGTFPSGTMKMQAEGFEKKRGPNHLTCCTPRANQNDPKPPIRSLSNPRGSEGGGGVPMNRSVGHGNGPAGIRKALQFGHEDLPAQSPAPGQAGLAPSPLSPSGMRGPVAQLVPSPVTPGHTAVTPGHTTVTPGHATVTQSCHTVTVGQATVTPRNMKVMPSHTHTTISQQQTGFYRCLGKAVCCPHPVKLCQVKESRNGRQFPRWVGSAKRT